MAPYRTLLIIVTVLSFLSIAGMREIRASLTIAIVFVNVFGWSWALFDKWNKQRNRLTVEGEQDLQVGNYAEAEKSLTLAAAEAESRGASAGKRATILRNLAEAQRKQGKLGEAEQTIQKAIALLSNNTGQSRQQYGDCLDVL